jgi:MFS family permease
MGEQMSTATVLPANVPPQKQPFYINRNFALLWSGQAISFLGDFIFDTTLILWIATRIAAGQSWAPLAVSGLLVCVFGPSLIGGPLAGVFVDRWDKRRTLLAMDAIRASVILGLLMVAGILPLHLPAAAQLALVYITVCLTTMCQQFFGPARMALIGDVVNSADRGRASGMGEVTMNLAVIVGPPLAAPLLFAFGVQWALAINALSFVASFAAVWLVHAPPSARSVPAGEQGNAWKELVEGLRFFGRNRILRTVLVASVFAMLGAGALNALDIFFVTQNLHTSPNLYGYLSSAFGAGAVVGAILSSVFVSRLGAARLFWVCLALAGVGMMGYARLTSFTPAVVALFALGIPVAALNVCIMPLILQATPREMIGRVSSVLSPIISLASIASIVLAGLLVSTLLHGFHARILGLRFGPVDTIFTGGGLLGVIGGVYAMISLRGVEGDASETSVASRPPAEFDDVGSTS